MTAGFGVLILLFLFGRMVVWWYFGIDRAVAALESIDASLKQLPAVRFYDNQLANEGRARRRAS